jgi:hypothetical protein
MLIWHRSRLLVGRDGGGLGQLAAQREQFAVRGG